MSRLSKNIVYNIIGQSLLIILGFVAVKFVFKQLGEDVLGLIYFTLTLNAVLCAVLEMGIGSTIVREVSSHFCENPEYVRNLIKTAALFYWAAYLLLAMLIYFCAPLIIEKWVHLSTMNNSSATFLVRILLISAFIALPRSLYVSIFRGIQKMEINNTIDVAAMALQQFGIVVILALGGGLLLVIYWLSISFIIGLFGYIFMMQRYFPWRTLIPHYDPTVVRKNIKFSSRMMSISLLSMIHMQADKLIVSKLLPIGFLGYYGLAYSVCSRATLLTNSVAQAAFPSFSSLFKTAGRRGMMPQYRKLQDLICYGTVPLFAILPFAALPLFEFVFNRDIAKMLLLPTTFLSLGFYMNGTFNVVYIFSLAVGKPEISARINFLALFIVLPLTVVFVYLFGINGAAFSWVFYHLFGYAYGMPQFCRECLEVSVAIWYGYVAKIFLIIGVSYGTAWCVLLFIGTRTLTALCLAYTGATIIFIIFAYIMIGDDLRMALHRICSFRKANGITHA